MPPITSLWIRPFAIDSCSLYVLLMFIAYEAGDLLKPTPAERSDPIEPAASLQPIQPSR